MERDEAEELLRNLFADPAGGASAVPETVLVPDPDPALSSIGHQVVGIVLRDLGDMDGALQELRTALRLARRSGDRARAADVMATLGISLCVVGRMRDGLRHLDEAATMLDGVPLARVLHRRAYVLGHLLARFEESAADLRRARELFSGSGDQVWEARVLNLQALVDVKLGEVESAAEAFARFGEISASLGDLVRCRRRRSQHRVAGLPSRRPAARARAVRRSCGAFFDSRGMTNVDLVLDQVAAYLSGGLAQDALAVVESALVARPLQPREEADLLVAVAGAALAADDWDRAVSAADEGSSLLRAQSRHVHRLEADLLSITARDRAGEPPAPLLRRAERVVDGDARGSCAPAAAGSPRRCRSGEPGPVGSCGRPRVRLARRGGGLPPRDHRFRAGARLAGAGQGARAGR